MGKYEPLGEFLRKQRGSEVLLTFAEIERITGTKLPPKAQHHRAWWSNNPSNNVMTKVWLEAGYQTERVDIRARRLLFRRVAAGARSSGRAGEITATSEARVVHPLLGALKGLVQIMPGTDLTQPADPDWGKGT